MNWRSLLTTAEVYSFGVVFYFLGREIDPAIHDLHDWWIAKDIRKHGIKRR